MTLLRIVGVLILLTTVTKLISNNSLIIYTGLIQKTTDPSNYSILSTYLYTLLTFKTTFFNSSVFRHYSDLLAFQKVNLCIVF